MAMNFTVWKVDAVRRCLDSFKINLHDMVTTMDNLILGVSSIYSFTPIVLNTENSRQKTKCDLDVHPLIVDMLEELDKVSDRFVGPATRKRLVPLLRDDLSAGALADLLVEKTEVSAIEFHSALNGVFAQLNDAHTTYTFNTMVLQSLPIEFSVASKEDGTLQVLVAPAVALSTTLGLGGMQSRTLNVSARVEEVSLINGDEPLRFLQKLANRRGTYLDPGQRLNSLLFEAPFLPELRDGFTCIVAVNCDLVPPGESAVELTLASGQRVVVEWVIFTLLKVFPAVFTQRSETYSFLEQQSYRKTTWRHARIEECKTISDCDISKLGTMIGPSDTQSHAAYAYRRVLGKYVPEEVLAEAALAVPERLAASTAAEDAGPLPPSRRLGLLRVAAKLAMKTTLRLAAKGMRRMVGKRSSAAAVDPAVREVQKYIYSLAENTTGDSDGDAQEVVYGHAAEDEKEDHEGSHEAESDADQAAEKLEVEVRTCLEGNGTGNSSDVEVVFVAADHNGEEWVTVFRVGDMAVFKLRSMGDQPVMYYIYQAMQAWAELVHYARQNGIKRLLLDIISNGGGLVALSDLLQSLILKDPDPRSLCNHYDKRINSYWRSWVLSYGQGIDQSIREQMRFFGAYAEGKSVEAVRMYAKYQAIYLRGLMDTSNKLLGNAFGCNATDVECCGDGRSAEDCSGSFIVDLEKLDGWIIRIAATTTKKEVLEIMQEALPPHNFIPKALFGGVKESLATNSSLNTTETSGWFPFTGDEILQPDTLEPFPHMTGILNGVQQFWGGMFANFSKRGVFQSCPSLMASWENMDALAQAGLPNLTEYLDHPFTDLALVTDGLAGSAASALPSRLQASPYVSAFSYGGHGGAKPMDTSGFAGGNVLDYEEWWPRVALAAELGMWLLPHKPWEELSRSMNVSRDEIGTPAVVYPHPMPLKRATARFNFNMMYIKEFAVEGDQTMLPRQFYRIPAHRQYDWWPKWLSWTCGNPAALLALYRRIQAEDWFEVRRTPQYLGRGWSSACVPDPSERECCSPTSPPPLLGLSARALDWSLPAVASLSGLVALGALSHCCRSRSNPGREVDLYDDVAVTSASDVA